MNQLQRRSSSNALSRDVHQKKAHWQSGGKRLTLFSWAHAQKQEAARRSADSKGPPADGKGSPAGADKASPPLSHHQSSGLLGLLLLIIQTVKKGSLSH
jgi:hypothetical protein